MPLWPRGAHHTCRGAHVCVLESCPCVLGMPKVVPWCLLGAVKASLICLRKHNGIMNNYKLKFQKSFSLHLHHLSQVCARCPSGAHDAHLVRTRCMFGLPVVCARCTSGSPMVSSLSPWSLNHQTTVFSCLICFII